MTRESDAGSFDRSVLPIAAPAVAPITEFDVSEATAPPRFDVTAPAGSPNVVVILIDNLGYGASTTFGGPMPMATLERLAANGLTYTDFHVNPCCSPTRMSLLTGRNCHSVNMGSITEMSTGFPGQTGVLPTDAAPLAEVLRLNGYSTAMFGKSHETPAFEAGPSGPFDRWPTGMGFERFYGNIGGETDMFNPSIHDNTTLMPPSDDPDFYYQTDVADQAIAWIKAQQSRTPDKPFFVYLPTAGTHSPVQVPTAWHDKYKGRFDAGWDAIRDETLARQKQLGIVPQNTVLAPKPDVMPDWDDLDDDEKIVCRRHQEVMAAFADITDHEIGRVVQAIDDLGVLDDTLVVYITGDNGATGNGGRIGYYNTFASFNQVPETLEDQLAHLDDFGGPHSVMTAPIGWSIADNTPFTETQFCTGYGGITNGAVISWPNGIAARGEIRRQYHHVMDIAPTVLAAIGLPQPAVVDGVAQRPIEGVSMLATFDDADAPATHTIQHYEFVGNRGIYQDGWYATTSHRRPWEPRPRGPLHDDQWELYDTTVDFACANDLATSHRDKLEALQAAFLEQAATYQVLPLDDRMHERFVSSIAGRPDIMDGRTSLTLYAGMVGMPDMAFIDIKNRDSTITADLDIPSGGANGVIIAQGGMHSGWSLYVKDNRPMYAYNFMGTVTTIAGADPLPEGRVTVAYDFDYDGGGLGKGGTGGLTVNGANVATGRLERTIPLIFSVETADVGIDLYTPVTDDYPRGDNAFTGTIHSVRVDVDESADPTRQALADTELVLHPRLTSPDTNTRHTRTAERSTMADLIRDLVVAGLLSGTQPITIMGLLLLRTGHRGRRNSFAFLTGAFAVETALLVLAAVVVGGTVRPDSDPGSVFLGVRVVIGVTFVVTGLMLRRPTKKESPQVPKSLQRLRNLSLGGAFVAGVLLADYVGPVLASLSIASTDVDTAGRLASIGFYTILATGIPAALLVISLQSERAGTRLDDSISWLMDHRRQIASWITLVLGVLLVANGIIGLIVVGNQ